MKSMKALQSLVKAKKQELRKADPSVRAGFNPPPSKLQLVCDHQSTERADE